MKRRKKIARKILRYAKNFTFEQAEKTDIPKKYKDLMLSKEFSRDDVEDFIFDLTENPKIFREIIGDKLALSKEFIEDINLTNFLKDLAKNKKTLD